MPDSKISPAAVVQTDLIGKSVEIGEFAVIRRDVIIGNNVFIHPHVVINSGVRIGDNVEIFPGALIGKEPSRTGAVKRKAEFQKKITIQSGCSIGPHAVIYYDVEIGTDTLIGDGVSIRELCRIGSECIIARHVTINYNATVGNRTRIMDGTHVTGNCRIGDDVFISLLVGMANDNALGSGDYKDTMLGPTIENHAMIGMGASLLPGVVIGEGAVVGAGSVVTKNVASKTLVIGMPARFVRRIENND